MDGKKKLAGWLVLTVIALVAAVALATTNLITEKPIAEQNLGENQQALKAMFPEADEFAEVSPGESSGVDFVYEVRQSGQTIRLRGQGNGAGVRRLHRGADRHGIRRHTAGDQRRRPRLQGDGRLGARRRSRSLPISLPEKHRR